MWGFFKLLTHLTVLDSGKYNTPFLFLSIELIFILKLAYLILMIISTNIFFSKKKKKRKAYTKILILPFKHLLVMYFFFWPLNKHLIFWHMRKVYKNTCTCLLRSNWVLRIIQFPLSFRLRNRSVVINTVMKPDGKKKKKTRRKPYLDLMFRSVFLCKDISFII